VVFLSSYYIQELFWQCGIFVSCYIQELFWQNTTLSEQFLNTIGKQKYHTVRTVLKSNRKTNILQHCRIFVFLLYSGIVLTVWYFCFLLYSGTVLTVWYFCFPIYRYHLSLSSHYHRCTVQFPGMLLQLLIHN
jgi:Flp pilus assembly protein TadB